ncbi:MAG: cobalamin-independent methionine synthase II family protein [bacterium]|jgi:5-methyltetrahydropteroyltriglutamate--homocysteine methyltransferase|nr:cobalamin-independent methionine synthase II family protein [bacterium]
MAQRQTGDRVTNVLLPTTMVGSYPRPRWYTRRAWGADLRVALMDQNWREEYEDAVKAMVNDQEVAGLDIVSDGEVYEDDLVGGAGWPEYVLSRIGGIENRAESTIGGVLDQTDILSRLSATWPAPVVTKPLQPGPLQFAFLYDVARGLASRPVKMSFVDPLLAALFLRDEHYGSEPGQPSPQLVMDLAHIYNQELRELAAAGCPIYQSDLPTFAQLGMMGAPDAAWNASIRAFNTTVAGTDGMQIWMHYCWGRPYGQFAYGHAGDFRPMFPRVFDADFHVLNIECGECLGPEMALLEQVPPDRAVAIGILDHRVLQVERPQDIADKIRRALRHISPERLYLTSFCGLGTTLPRTVAFYKLKALVDGAKLVRAELEGRPVPESVGGPAG